MPDLKFLLLLLLLTVVWTTGLHAEENIINDTLNNVTVESNSELMSSFGNNNKQIKQKDQLYTPHLWGVALTYRTADIPFYSDDRTVNDVVPLLFYENGRFFWRALEAGYIVADDDKWNFSLLGRYRYFDIPKQNQNQVRGSGTDLGLRYRYKHAPELSTDVEIMNDTHGREYANFRINYHLNIGDWDIFPYITLRWKSSEFNNHYYGLDSELVGNDFDFTFGSTVRYHVHDNLYLLGRAAITQLAPNTYRASTIATPTQTELFLGFAFFDDKKKPRHRLLKSKPYFRIAHGSATPTNLGEILKGRRESDAFNNKLTSIFYGLPVSDTFFGINMPVYVVSGYVQHHSSDVQNSFPEYVVAVKVYYTVNWLTKWRLGIAQGLSYTREINYVEKKELLEKGYRTSNLLNYMDFSIDADLGDLFNFKSLDNVWLGYSIHHRSGIFESSSAYGRIKGGSNYTTVYLQYHW